MPDELGGDGLVVAARDPGPVPAPVGHGALRLEREHQDMREPGAQGVHRPLRAARVGERDGHEVVLVPGVAAEPSRSASAAAEHAQPPVGRRGHLLRVRRPAVVQLDQPAALAVRRFSENEYGSGEPL